MAEVNAMEIANRLHRECVQTGQNVKFNFVSAEIRFFNVTARIKLPYTTEMHARFSFRVPVSEWNKDDWRVFVRDAIDYYEKHSKYELDRVDSLTLTTRDGLSISFLV